MRRSRPVSASREAERERDAAAPTRFPPPSPLSKTSPKNDRLSTVAAVPRPAPHAGASRLALRGRRRRSLSLSASLRAAAAAAALALVAVTSAMDGHACESQAELFREAI